MKIVINTRGGHLEAGLTFLKQTFACLINNHPEHEFIFLADPGTSWIPDARNVLVPNAGSTLDQPLLIRWWHYYRLPLLLKKYGADLLINANGICCMRTSLPQFLLLSDETCLHIKRSKKHIPGTNVTRKRISRNNLSAYVMKASRILVISETAKTELVRLFKIEETKILVTGCPVDKIYQPLKETEKQAVKTEFTEGKEYFLYHGAISPHQNIITLLKAFSLFKKRQLSNMHLVLTGPIHWPGTSFTEKMGTYKFRKDVQVLPSLDNPEMAKVTASAYAMVLPSNKPGFSIPQLQALNCNTPVISAAIHPEPGHNAVLKANADSAEEIASQMKLLYKDENLRADLINKGGQEKKQYTAEVVCNKIWNSINLQLNNPSLISHSENNYRDKRISDTDRRSA